MIGRKLVLIRNGYVFEERHTVLNEHYFEELKISAVRNIKKLGFIILVAAIRLYVKFSSFMQSVYQQALVKIKDMLAKKSANGEIVEIGETNKFLKMVGQYKRRIRKIKEKVKEEENL